MTATAAIPKLLTLEDVAARLKVAKVTVERWIADQDLPSFKKGGCRRVSEPDLAQFVLLNTVRAKRPDWLTPGLELDARNIVRAIVKEEVGMVQWLGEQQRKAMA